MRAFLDVLMIGAALSWGQCWAFCAPVLLPYVAGTQKGWREGLAAGLTFSLARVIPYIIWSAVSAGFGRCLFSRVDKSCFPVVIDVITGLLLSLLGIMVLTRRPLLPSGCHKGCSQGKKKLFLLGFLTGAVPCAPMLGLLVYIAVKTESLLRGALLGLAFGIGTLFSPLFLFTSLAGGAAGFLRGMPRADKVFSSLCGLILLYSGVGMVMRVLF